MSLGTVGILKRTNIADPEFAWDDSDPEGFRADMARLGKLVGAEETGISVYELPPGQAVCPYHYEYEEEWLLVLDGSVVVRTPEGERELARGGIVCFAPGAAGAHQVTNASDTPARLLMFSSAHEPAVAIYPDSGKLGVWTPGGEDNMMLHREDGRVDYWDGEHRS